MYVLAKPAGMEFADLQIDIGGTAAIQHWWISEYSIGGSMYLALVDF